MSKKLFVFNVLFLSLIMFLGFSVKTFAMTPTLSLSGNGDGNSVQVSVNGDANASVLLFYTKTGSGSQFSSIGTTNASGVLNTTLSSSYYGIASGTSVYVTTGGINGAQSSPLAWPAVASMLSPSNMMALSQTGLVLTLGQTANITVSNIVNSGLLYLASNSNPQIANFNISGSQVAVVGNSYGSTTGSICLVGNSSNCGSIYVIVQNSSATPLTFSQSSVTLSPGQNIAIQISGGSGSYTVFNNSSQNNAVVTTSISASTINLNTTSTTGSASITVCSTDMNACGIINVTIGNTTSSVVSFSQTNPTVTVAQSLNVSVYGPASSLFYVASNSNPNTVQANLSGTTLTLLGISNGTSMINVCASTNNCASLNVTVNSNTSTSGKLMMSQDSVTLAVGQSANITISGGTMPYSIVSSGNNLVQANLNSNILTLVGLSGGSSMMNVCSAAGTCNTLSITVNGTVNTSVVPFINTATTPAVTTSSTSDCTTATKFSPSSGTACPNYVVPTVTFTSPTNDQTSTDTTSTAYKFTKTIKMGSKGTEVTELQKKLSDLGYYKGKIDGKFGAGVDKAVKAFQKAHKLSQVGSVGPQTRALLNK